MKKILLCLLLTFALILPAQAEESPFSDIEEGDKYYDAVIYLRDAGIIAGYDDGTFKPDDEVNRVEALKIILKSADIDCSSGTTESIFTDVVGTEWYYEYLSVGIERNIVSGYDDGTFQPDNPVNLAEALKILVNTNELVATNPQGEDFYTDAETDAWYSGYLNYAGENGLVYADAENNIYPSDNLTRAELAYIIYRYETGYFSGEMEYGKATYYGNIFNGMGTASGEIFDETAMTAAHKTLPFGTNVRVTNLANNQTVEVYINDRGPYGEGRIIDLSKSAFEQIGSLGTGVLNVEDEIIYPEEA